MKVFFCCFLLTAKRAVYVPKSDNETVEHDLSSLYCVPVDSKGILFNILISKGICFKHEFYTQQM